MNSEITEVDSQIDLKSGGLTQINRVFSFKDYDTSFEPKYPLMCVQDSSSQKLHVQSQSRFPSEIKKDCLFLGNMTNILNKDYFQLTMLKISTIFYMSGEPFPDIDKHFKCVHKPIVEKQKPLIDFDELSEEVQGLMKEGPVLLMCVSG